MREGHHLIKRVAETLDLGGDEDLFGHELAAPEPQSIKANVKAPELSFGDALRSLLGSTTAGSSTSS